MSMVLTVGSEAPDFEATADDGKTVKLSDFTSKGPVVLYFYPKDETPGCTAEACAFRDEWDDFKKLGAAVVGVSSDSVDSHRKFKEHRKLPFTLVSDPDQKIRAMYGAKGFLIPPRISFVIVGGKVVHVYNSQMNATNHVAEAKKAIQKFVK